MQPVNIEVPANNLGYAGAMLRIQQILVKLLTLPEATPVFARILKVCSYYLDELTIEVNFDE